MVTAISPVRFGSISRRTGSLLQFGSKPPAPSATLPEYRRTRDPASRLPKEPEGLGLDAGGSLVGSEPGRRKGGVKTIGASSTEQDS